LTKQFDPNEALAALANWHKEKAVNWNETKPASLTALMSSKVRRKSGQATHPVARRLGGGDALAYVQSWFLIGAVTLLVMLEDDAAMMACMFC